MAEEAQSQLIQREPAVDVALLTNIGGGHVRLEALGFETLLNVRGRPDDSEFLEAVAGALDVALPLVPNTTARSRENGALWLGPDEWLVVAPDGRAAALEERFCSACGDDPWCSIVDVSHNTTSLVLAGPAARHVLAKGCPLDLHPRVFGPERCAQSLLAGTRILLSVGGAPESFELRVRNSFARYLVAWLTDASREFSD